MCVWVLYLAILFQARLSYLVCYSAAFVLSAASTTFSKSEDITSGLQYVRPTKEPKMNFKEPETSCVGNTVRANKKAFTIDEIFTALLSQPTHASKSRVFRHYDKNILGNTVIEPGEGDCSVIMPLSDIDSYATDGPHPGWSDDLSESDRHVGVALACGGNSRYGRISPYLQGVNAVVENVRNVATAGALPRCITDCLNYGNPEIPEQLWALEQGVKGIADAAKGLSIGGAPIPVVSGNVSLYNATREGPVDPTANVCIAGVMADGRKAISMQMKKAGSKLYLLGDRKDECGGSAYYHVLEMLTGSKRNAMLGANVPSPDFAEVLKEITFMSNAVEKGLLLAAHDISEGGLLLALYEMTLPQRKVGGLIGVACDVGSVSPGLRPDLVLFSETGGFVVEVDQEHVAAVESLAKKCGLELIDIGVTTHESSLSVKRSGTTLIDKPLEALRSVWTDALERALHSS
jgi:phosphoribosylformylglycinamidine synthase